MSQNALTFAEMRTKIASQLGVAYYGADGDEIAQPPTDTFTLQQIKDYINDGFRMLLDNAPPEGWTWQRPTASFVVWATVTTGAVTVSGTSNTTLTSASSDFYPSMVGHAIVSDTLENSYTITAYTSATVVTVSANASADSGDTFTITADGNYTLPDTFGGEFSGPITYASGTNPGASVRWGSEGDVRRFRENASSQTGYPTYAAVRKMADVSTVTRRWEMVVYPTPGADYTLEFPYQLYFTALSADGDLHPAGAHYDGVVLAAARAVAEMEGQDIIAGRVQYYQENALPSAYRINRRSTPRLLGTLLNPGVSVASYRDSYERPDVNFT